MNDAVIFLESWLEHPTQQREDYLEFAQLSLLYLTGKSTVGDSYKLRAPAAYHHARWMSKVLYVIKLALLKPTFLEPNMLERVLSPALFCSIYYS